MIKKMPIKEKKLSILHMPKMNRPIVKRNNMEMSFTSIEEHMPFKQPINIKLH